MRISDWSSDVCSSDLGIDRVGEDIGAVDALEAECGSGGAAGRDREEFTRRLDRRERRIAVGDVGAHAIGQAAEDAGRIAVAAMVLDARANVLFVEIIRDWGEPRCGCGFPRQYGREAWEER